MPKIFRHIGVSPSTKKRLDELKRKSPDKVRLESYDSVIKRLLRELGK